MDTDTRSLSDTEILQKFAYESYEMRKSRGLPSEPLRDWSWAEELFNHLVDPRFDDVWWQLRDEDVTEEQRELFRRRNLNA